MNQNLKSQREYLEYIEFQRENYIDLAEGLVDQNDSIRFLAEKIFREKPLDIRYDLIGILFDDETESVDLFCIMLELLLYGLNIITNDKANIFMLEETTEDIVYILKNYFRCIGMSFTVTNLDLDPDTFRDTGEYYCEIVPKPIRMLCDPKDWYILKYRMILNNRCQYNMNTKLDYFKAYFLNNNDKVFSIHFSFSK